MSSPRAWGCFSSRTKSAIELRVFPTCVGVFPFSGCCATRRKRLPHVRGGVSGDRQGGQRAPWSSPRAWGCFYIFYIIYRCVFVFPTCVGVFLTTCRLTSTCDGLPHVRGGVSRLKFVGERLSESSPRAWGCFHNPVCRARVSLVFPTCVGVFPAWIRLWRPTRGLPHVRGGVSDYQKFRF